MVIRCPLARTFLEVVRNGKFSEFEFSSDMVPPSLEVRALKYEHV
jgi:hypothetical protein